MISEHDHTSITVRVNATYPDKKHVAIDVYPDEGPGEICLLTAAQAREHAAAVLEAANRIDPVYAIYLRAGGE